MVEHKVEYNRRGLTLSFIITDRILRGSTFSSLVSQRPKNAGDKTHQWAQA